MIIMKKYRYLFLTIISVGLMVLCSCKKEKFIVSFNTLGGSYIESQEINKKDLVNQPNYPIKDGYRFAGWYTTESVTEGNKYNFNDPVINHFVLYAKWEKLEYTIVYHLDGGQGLNLPVTFQTNDRLTLDSPQKAGYKFVGWYSNSDFSGEIVTEIIGTCQKDLDLYAKWNEIYYLSLIGNGGQIEENTIEFTKDDEIILPIPTKNNANFIGWYSNSDFSGEMVTKIEKGTTHNITLYAKWERLYQLSYDANGGTMPDNYDTSYYLGEGKVLPIPTKNGYLLKI